MIQQPANNAQKWDRILQKEDHIISPMSEKNPKQGQKPISIGSQTGQ